MTFDLEAARKICDIRKHVAETGCYDAKADREAADMLPAALDEVERLLNREKWLLEDNEKRAIEQNEQAKHIAECTAILSQAQRVIVESQKVEAQLRERIAELEASDQNWKTQYDWLFAWSIKQRAALKKLGAKYHEQREGRRSDARLYDASQTAMASQIMKLQEALMEETAWSMFNAETQGIRQDPPYQDVVERYERETRQQLRREGLL